ncbi:glycoside hydrolase family 127 protein [Kineococcus sp. NUM-3379]
MTPDAATAWPPGGPLAPSEGADTALRPLDHRAFRLAGEGWLGAWQTRTVERTLPHVLRHVRRGEAWTNLARLTGASSAPFTGMLFTDSDVHKVLEAVAWAAPFLPAADERLRQAEELVDLLVRAQEADGYLNSRVQGDPGVPRWSDPQWGHELYTAGHLFQAAVAAARCGVLPRLVDVARRNADLLVASLGAEDCPHVDGHPEVETALVELYRVTGGREYLDPARRQLDRRGSRWLGGSHFGSQYFQDDVPLRQATRATGHAVRQLYLAAGAVDVAVETGERELLDYAVRIWEDLQAGKTYVTGVHGSRHRDEAIGDPYELPPDRAYAETCAAIAAFQLAWRLLVATGEARYADAMETTLYNAVAVSTSADGTAFFYSNPLHLRTGHDGTHEDAPSQRLPWFTCACCPPNLARLLTGIHDYCLTTSAAGVQVHHPTAGTAELDLGGAPVRLGLRTRYPLDGAVDLTVATASAEPFELAVRIPAWCTAWTLTVDGEPAGADAPDGYVRTTRSWRGTHEVALRLDTPVRAIAPHPRVDAVRGCVALARGPVLFALEEADLPAGVVLEDVRLLALTGESAGGSAGGSGGGSADDPAVTIRAVTEVPARPGALYTSGEPAPTCSGPFDVDLVPYHRWGNRTPGAMRVWIPTAPGVR